MGWFKICESEAKNLPKEKQQQILDDINSGKTIGWVKENRMATLEAVCGVINMNIDSIQYLRTTVPRGERSVE